MDGVGQSFPGGQELSVHKLVRGSDEGVSMKKLLLFTASITLLALPVYAETVGEKTGVNSTLGIAPTTPDFVQEAAISDMFEIQSSKMASGKLSGPEKEFADHMVADHSKTTTELT